MCIYTQVLISISSQLYLKKVIAKISAVFLFYTTVSREANGVYCGNIMSLPDVQGSVEIILVQLLLFTTELRSPACELW